MVLCVEATSFTIISYFEPYSSYTKKRCIYSPDCQQAVRRESVICEDFLNSFIPSGRKLWLLQLQCGPQRSCLESSAAMRYRRLRSSMDDAPYSLQPLNSECSPPGYTQNEELRGGAPLVFLRVT